MENTAEIPIFRYAIQTQFLGWSRITFHPPGFATARLNALAALERSPDTMTHISHPIRPARAAIAAVLALTATPLLAQEASPAPTLSPTIAPTMPQPQPNAPTTAQPGVAPQATLPAPTAQPPAASLPGTPMVSPVAPPTVTDIPVAAIAPAAEMAAPPVRRAAATPRPSTRPAPETARAAPAPEPQPSATAAAPIEAPMIEQEIAPAPVTTGEPSMGAPLVDETVAATDTGSNGDVWGWMAGLLALLGIGGGAIALRRTRTRKSAAMMAEARASDAVHDRGLAGPHDRPSAVFVTAQTSAAPATAIFAQPVVTQPTPAATAPARPAIRPAARPMKAPHGDVDANRLEQLIDQRPNRDNPFKTRANRKRRALFLMRNGYGMQTAA